MKRVIRSSRELAFTLAELMVAMAITIVIIAILFQVFSATAGQWQNADRRTDAFRDARAAIQLMGRDLGRANLNGDVQMLTVKDVSGGFAKEAYAVTPIPNGGKSALCAVGYYCAWDGDTKTFTLKRLFRDSNASIGNLDGPNPDFTALFAKGGGQEEDLAAYAWDLRFTPGTGAVAVSPGTSPATWDWVEIRFKCLSPAAAAKLKAMPISQATWADPNNALYRTNILPAEQQFVSRVTLQQSKW